MKKIPYLKTLGVTAVELMPVQEFNETSVTRRNPRTNQPLKNYWGYDSVAFFAPKASYSSSGGSPNWSDPNAKQLACLIHEDQRNSLYLMFNAWTGSVDFGLPALLPGTRWRLAVDTSGEAQQDLFAPGTEPLWEDPRTYHLRPRSSAILLAR